MEGKGIEFTKNPLTISSPRGNIRKKSRVFRNSRGSATLVRVEVVFFDMKPRETICPESPLDITGHETHSGRILVMLLARWWRNERSIVGVAREILVCGCLSIYQWKKRPWKLLAFFLKDTGSLEDRLFVRFLRE